MSNREIKSKNIKKNKDLKKWCKFCAKWKREEEYSTNGKCLACRRKHRKQQIEGEIKEIGLAAHLLKNSCRRAFYRCGKKKGYEQIKCEFDNYHDMFNDLKNIEKFWKSWQKQTSRYEELNELESERPTLDRIFPDGHYSLNNIQCLSQEKNRLKAKNTPTNLFYFDENGVFSYKPYPTIKAAAIDLNVNYEKLRRNRDVKVPFFIDDGQMYLLQSSNS